MFISWNRGEKRKRYADKYSTRYTFENKLQNKTKKQNRLD